jgi:glyoxylase-like metal-dependent hydrolase (beta-lactamase superfamily II)
MRPIDVRHMGRENVIRCWEVDDLLIDPGPASSMETLLAALDGGRPRALVLTHIHLDHAGATGSLVRRWPDTPVYVHERGAPHLIDPSKLLKSAGRLYGEDNMERMWGEVAPVPEENVHVLSGGETVEGFRVAYTPGHASHHVCYLHQETGDAYVGDVGGVKIPPSDFTLAPTPPPDIDLEAWFESLEKVEEWDPVALRLTHFGLVGDPAGQLNAVRERLEMQARHVRDGTREAFVDELRTDALAASDPETAESYFQAAPPDQLWQGLERYWAKREAAQEAS